MAKTKTRDATDILNEMFESTPAEIAQIEQRAKEYALAWQITELRKARGLTQAQLAEMLGTTQPAISRIESANYEGHSLKLMKKVAEALGAELVFGLRPRKDAKVRGAAKAVRKPSPRRRKVATKRR